MPSMRLFKKRKSLAPGEGEAKGRPIPESTRLPYAATPQSEQQATLADVATGVSAGLDGVSKGDVHGKSGHATSSDDVLSSASAATEAGQPVPCAEDEAATRPIGRSNSKRDRFRLFRSRSTHFRKGTDDGGKGGGGHTKTRLSWPAPRSTTTAPTPLPEPGARTQAQAQARTQTPPRGHAECETVEESVSAADASPSSPPPPPPLRPPPPTLAEGPNPNLTLNLGQQPPQPKHHQQPQRQPPPQTRPTSVFGPLTTTSSDTSSSPSWRLQTLKRLPSLSLKRRLTRRDKPKPPQVIVTPATVVS